MLDYFERTSNKKVGGFGGRANSSHVGHVSSASCVTLVRRRGVLLIGGMILDIHATSMPEIGLNKGDSAPGKVVFAPGGVARNIAHSLSILTAQANVYRPILVSVLGRDEAGKNLLMHWKSIGADDSFIFQVPSGRTPIVTVIFDGNGDVAASVADVSLCEEHLTSEIVYGLKEMMKQCQIVVLDGDISSKTILTAAELARACGCKIWFEPVRSLKFPCPLTCLVFWTSSLTITSMYLYMDCTVQVSATKAVRCIDAIHLLDFVSPNLDELNSMAERLQTRLGISGFRQLGKIEQEKSALSLDENTREVLQGLFPKVFLLLCSGVRTVVVTLGHLGAATCALQESADGNRYALEVSHLPALSKNVLNCSGAGDALVAGYIHGMLVGKENKESLACGMVAAKSVVEDHRNVCETIDVQQMLKTSISIAEAFMSTFRCTIEGEMINRREFAGLCRL